MAVEIKVPIPDQTTQEVRIVSWRKAVGDAVKKGEVVLEIETDKAVMEVESAGEGVVLKQLVKVDDIVPVGEVVGYIGAAGEEAAAGAAEPAKTDQQPDEEKPADSSFTKKKIAITPLARKIAEKIGLNFDNAEGTGSHGKIMRKDIDAGSSDQASSATLLHDGRLIASPNAKRLAKELSVDLRSVKGTGAEGRITGKDVQAYAGDKPVMDHSPAAGQPQPGTEVELTKMRRAIGINLQKSFRDTPHFNVTMSIDMTRAIKFRSEINKGKEKSEKVSVNDLVVKACALALKKYPAVNSKFMEDRIRYEADVNVGVATALDTGLVVPVVLNTDKLDWKQLAAATKAIIKQAKEGRLVGVGKGTFTVSNLGMFGVDEFTAIINPPEAAILAVGGLKQEVVVIDGMIGIRPIMKITLCSDHRVVDGALAAQFLLTVKCYLEEDIS